MSEESTLRQEQETVWETEYTGSKKNYGVTDPAIAHLPSRAIEMLYQYFDGKAQPQGLTVLDLACGLGLKSFNLLKKGYASEAICVDFTPAALEQGQVLAEQFGLADQVTWIEQNLGDPLFLESESVDLALDIFGSMGAYEADRIRCCDEIWRVLKPGGYLLAYLISTESYFIQNNQGITLGPEQNSIYHQGTNKFEKAFTEAEIREFYAQFNILHIQTAEYPGEFPFTMFWVLMRKPEV